MFITLLLLVCALALSSIAAWYSIIGLATIFAGAFYPVIIMGSILEASKLVVSSWLYQRWKVVPLLLRTYLTIAVIILMCITSIGIFGFLSKAHIDQTIGTQENLAQIEKINNDIAQNKIKLERASNRLKQLETSGGGADVNLQNQINTEQQRIDSAYARIQPAIDEQNKIIESQTKLISDQLSRIDQETTTLQKYIDNNEIQKAQALVGTRADGNWGPGTANAVKAWQQQKQLEKSQIVAKLEDINQNNSTIKRAREEIARLRDLTESQISESNKLINRLRDQLGKSSAETLSKDIQDQQEIIKVTSTEIDKITEKKYQLESSYRKLEAEVGPIKYIANFIYDSKTDATILEKSVIWMIITIIFVFDPLAVLMLIAANTDLKKKIQNTSNITLVDVETNSNTITRPNHNIEKIQENTVTTTITEKPIITVLTELNNSVQSSNVNVDTTKTDEIINPDENTQPKNVEIVSTSYEPTANTTVSTSITKVPKPAKKIDADTLIKKLDTHKKKTNQPVIEIKRDYRGYKY